MCMYIYIYIYIYTYIYICKCVCVRVCIHTHAHTYIHTYICIYIHTYIYTDRQTDIHIIHIAATYRHNRTPPPHPGAVHRDHAAARAPIHPCSARTAAAAPPSTPPHGVPPAAPDRGTRCRTGRSTNL